jgi:homoserine O-acetyltransferase/O-succinyltransferase
MVVCRSQASASSPRNGLAQSLTGRCSRRVTDGLDCFALGGDAQKHLMKRRCLVWFTLVALLPLAAGSLSAAQPAPQAGAPLERREFVIRDFRTESGVVLPEARVVYSTLGTLNATGDNAILLPSHYMANFNGYNWLIRGSDPNRVFDPARDFLILTELFGNGRSSSPSNTPEPLHGPRFPIITIRDNVDAVYRLVTTELRVKHLRAVVGFSMGAEQAFQWAVSHPDFMDAIVATSGTAKCYGHGYVRLEGQIAALTTDPVWQGGDYTTPPAKGLEAFSMVWAGWLYSQEWWRQELWRTTSVTTFEQAVQGYRRRFSADANDYILQARTWQRHDVGTTPGFDGSVEKALRSIKARVLYMPSETDLYFPITDARYEQALIPRVTFTPIPSLWGHTAGAASNPADLRFLNDRIAAFLNLR